MVVWTQKTATCGDFTSLPRNPSSLLSGWVFPRVRLKFNLYSLDELRRGSRTLASPVFLLNIIMATSNILNGNYLVTIREEVPLSRQCHVH